MYSAQNHLCHSFQLSSPKFDELNLPESHQKFLDLRGTSGFPPGAKSLGLQIMSNLSHWDHHKAPKFGFPFDRRMLVE